MRTAPRDLRRRTRRLIITEASPEIRCVMVRRNTRLYVAVPIVDRMTLHVYICTFFLRSFFFSSPDHMKPHLHHRTRERNEMSETIVTPAESLRSENRKRCAIAARGIGKSSGNENGIGKAEIEIELAGTSIRGKRGETVNRTCPSLRWPITDLPRRSRGPEVRKSSSIREASLCPVLFFLSSPRYCKLNTE